MSLFAEYDIKITWRNIIVRNRETKKVRRFIHSIIFEGDGESLLFNTVGLKYVFIDSCGISKFTALARIWSYSPASTRTGYVCPYACDINMHYYLPSANVILESVPNAYSNDPYDYFYDVYVIVSEDGDKTFENLPLQYAALKCKEYDGPVEFVWVPNPEKTYDRYAEMGATNYSIGNDGGKVYMTKNDYVQTVCRFGKVNGFTPLLFTTF